ncbi:LLM class flavin-dependent oxidoreductase [Actinomadura algeriensis]|uniref:Alkanesulfonate monooxygenase SsuD/methylene tetrahydromethanopterin reductase-like flavin-dependent oxidoreductase (Luciferase family) n=1 Tax=Actinomadura algeriensis TaxID=1679523 RepID=A0ABR9JV00_9ACTN|nr:LLM class flavin-dependent oxidoreductase [Actinomadura algeriensis]MBE1534239.1 alkanesulfonate monooxygenase SsuD/methylene tetrahydromethanopterin reductase-like flavin-dependent oxidoreductase (luciferase family) [Actinomadura algeriensis]
MKLGLNLPSHGVDTSATVAEHARHAEDAGFESVWVGDHLIPAGRPFLDATLVLAAVAAVTERVKLGFGVMVLPLRETAWAAKQIASLQHLSGGRVLLGVGSGGPVHGDAAFRAVGVPFAERGRRTDEALEVLAGLVEGRRMRLDGADVTLSPGAAMPPVLIGAGPERRVARFADEWYPAFSTPAEVSAGVGRLASLAVEHGRPVPQVTVGLSFGLGDVPAGEVDAQVKGLTEYGMSEDAARASLLTGPPERAAERLAELADAGVHRVVGMPFPSDRRRQAELLAEAARRAAV